MTAAPVLRTAVAGDGAAIARCLVVCWRETYAHLVSQEYLDGLGAALDDRAEMWEQSIGRGNRIHVADVDGEVVGLAAAGAPHDDEDHLPDLELWVIYVLAAHHGTGLGQQLLDAAIGDRPAYLWVAEDNPRTHSFYRRNGFRPDGARKTEPRFEDMVEVRLVRPGSATPAPSTGPASPSR